MDCVPGDAFARAELGTDGRVKVAGVPDRSRIVEGLFFTGARSGARLGGSLVLTSLAVCDRVGPAIVILGKTDVDPSHAHSNNSQLLSIYCKRYCQNVDIISICRRRFAVVDFADRGKTTQSSKK